MMKNAARPGGDVRFIQCDGWFLGWCKAVFCYPLLGAGVASRVGVLNGSQVASSMSG